MRMLLRRLYGNFTIVLRVKSRAYLAAAMFALYLVLLTTAFSLCTISQFVYDNPGIALPAGVIFIILLSFGMALACYDSPHANGAILPKPAGEIVTKTQDLNMETRK